MSSLTPQPSLKILLVEDNHLNQKVAALTLKRFGHLVDVVDNGLEAITKVAENTYDVIMMDLQMPGMDGFETTDKIRKMEIENKVEKPVCVIALTANAFSADRERCLESGMNRYLSKPFTPNQLIEILRNV
jgi:CheY-like chemotaxis protein